VRAIPVDEPQRERRGLPLNTGRVREGPFDPVAARDAPPRRIALLEKYLGGGIGWAYVNLANTLIDFGVDVDIVVEDLARSRLFFGQLRPDAHVVRISRLRRVLGVPALARYLHRTPLVGMVTTSERLTTVALRAPRWCDPPPKLVASWQNFNSEWLRPVPSARDPPPGFWERTVPDVLLTALDSVPKRFDAIVVDEGQDFLDSWWDPLMLSLTDPGGGILYVFHDDNQNLYRRANAFPAGMMEIPLRDNLRNTQKISDLTAKFYRGDPMRALGPAGQDVERIVVRDASEVVRAASRVLHRLIKDNGVPPSDIAVLMGSKRAGALRSGARIGAFETTEDQVTEPSKVLLESIRRFKGLERPVVVLTGIDDLAADEETALLYVGLSRARVHLVVIATDETMKRLGLAGSE